MSIYPTPLTHRPSWQKLEEHYHTVRDLHLRTLFAEDPHRGKRFALEAVGIYLDYSKNRVTDETIRRNEALIGTLEGLITDYGGQ